MGINLEMPAESDPARREAARYAHIVGCDRMPWHSRTTIHDGILSICRDSNEGGSVRVPWRVDGFGEIVLQTGCLMQRDRPYQLEVELARGQVTQIRNQLAEWELAGWVPDLALQDQNTQVVRLLREAIIADAPSTSREKAVRCLNQSLRLAEQLCRAHAIHELRSTPRDSVRSRLGCFVDPLTKTSEELAALCRTFGHLTLPVRWSSIEPSQGDYRWEGLDQQIESCEKAGIPFAIGPIVDFHPSQLPGWLARFRDNPRTYSTLLVDFVESCVGRYQGRAQEWSTTIGTNAASLRGFNEEQHIWLTRQLFEAAQDADPYARYSLGVRQPWGEYLLKEGRTYCPFSFTDALLRLDIPIQGLDLEVAMGFPERGSFCRSLLDFSQLLDHYARLSVPMHVNLYFPSAAVLANTAEDFSYGSWHSGPSPEAQADWAWQATLVAIAHRSVKRVSWGSHRDMPDDLFPFAGLHDHAGNPKPAWEKLQAFLRKISSDQSSSGDIVERG